MKIPKLFTPERNLDEKVKDLKDGKIKNLFVNEGKRKVCVMASDKTLLAAQYIISEFQGDTIYATINKTISDLNSRLTILESLKPFEFPAAPEGVYEHFTSITHSNSTRYYKCGYLSQKEEEQYFKLILEMNDCILVWDDEPWLQEYKKKLEKKCPEISE